MSTLQRMMIASFLPILVIALSFFILVLQLLDIFANLWRYLAHDATLGEIMAVALLYLPKCISYSLPAALLFTISYNLGNLYRNNELIAILGSGISLYRLVLPYMVISLVLSIGGFMFEDKVVIDTLQRKNEMYRAVVNQNISLSNSNVAVISADGRTVYHVDYYNDRKESISNVTIMIQDSTGRLPLRIDAEWGQWNGRVWVLHGCRIYQMDPESPEGILKERRLSVYDQSHINEPPSTFRRTTGSVQEMKRREAIDWIRRLKRAGLPYREALTEYYKKHFFALSPFIVALIASGVGGRFKRNILLMNLLTALVISVVYYVVQMVAMILAKNGYIPPLAGAASSFIIFLLAGGLILKTART